MTKSLLAASLLLALASPLAATAAPLTQAEAKAALTGLDDEYHALAFYQAVIDKFGPVRPFSNVIKAEARHAAALGDILRNSGVSVPANPYLDGTKPAPEAPATLALACAAGVQAELENRTLYDGNLLPAAQGNPELTQILTALRDASEKQHLPAFQRCAG